MKSAFILRRGHYATHPDTQRLVFVAVYEVPHELPDSVLEYRLRKYGTIYSTRRDKVPGYSNVFNGLRHLHMQVDTNILCFLRFGKFQVRIKYDGQPIMCRRCSARDHIFKNCKNMVCYNCNQVGHHSRDCTEDMHCCTCKEEGHFAIDCHHSWYRRPQVSAAFSQSSEDSQYPGLEDSRPDSTLAESLSVPVELSAQMDVPGEVPASSDVQGGSLCY